MAKHTAYYPLPLVGNDTAFPEVRQKVEVAKDHTIYLYLPDEAKVKLINPPNPKLVGKEGYWGELKKELGISYEVSPPEFLVEVSEAPIVQCWLCDPRDIREAIHKLRDNLSRLTRWAENPPIITVDLKERT